MTILAIDTTTNRGNIALVRDGRVLLDEFFTADRSQSSDLFPILERARALAGKINLIAVGLGPGSYAGARIAIAAALGLSCALGTELVGLPSVVALETDANEYVAIGDARRDTYYFSRVKNGECIDGPHLLEVAALHECLATTAPLPIFSPTPIPAFPQATIALPVAKTLAQLAAEGRSIAQRVDLEPLYLRDPHITQPKR